MGLEAVWLGRPFIGIANKLKHLQRLGKTRTFSDIPLLIVANKPDIRSFNRLVKVSIY